jgi:hypothetical protein
MKPNSKFPFFFLVMAICFIVNTLLIIVDYLAKDIQPDNMNVLMTITLLQFIHYELLKKD